MAWCKLFFSDSQFSSAFLEVRHTGRLSILVQVQRIRCYRVSSSVFRTDGMDIYIYIYSLLEWLTCYGPSSPTVAFSQQRYRKSGSCSVSETGCLSCSNLVLESLLSFWSSVNVEIPKN